MIALSPHLSRVWNIIIHMFATNVGSSLYLERKRRALIIVNNRTDIPFVTGDQPAINLKGSCPIRRMISQSSIRLRRMPDCCWPMLTKSLCIRPRGLPESKPSR